MSTFELPRQVFQTTLATLLARLEMLANRPAGSEDSKVQWRNLLEFWFVGGSVAATFAVERESQRLNPSN